MGRRAVCSIVILLVIVLLAAGFYVFGDWKTGAGGQSVKTASGIHATAIFGLKRGGRLGFLIVVRFPDTQTTTSASSRWIGSASHSNGRKVEYVASMSDIEINGRTFDFEDGKVFVADARDEIEIHQLDLEIRDSDASDEIERLAGAPEVAALLP